MGMFNDNGVSDEAPTYQVTEGECSKCYSILPDYCLDGSNFCATCSPKRIPLKITQEVINDASRWVSHKMFRYNVHKWFS